MNTTNSTMEFTGRHGKKKLARFIELYSDYKQEKLTLEEISVKLDVTNLEIEALIAGMDKITAPPRTYLHTRQTKIDGEYDMEGGTASPQELIEKMTRKARRMLNPKNLPDLKFNEKWTFYKGRSRNKIMKDEFLKNGGSFEYIAWSDYAGGNRFEVSGGSFKDIRKWGFIGQGRFS